KAAENETIPFTAQPEAIAPTRVAFIGTGSTASASEMVINGMAPFLGANMALVGTNTYGKPVGQIALDRPECDDRLRAVALKVENAEHQGEYYGGLATTVPNTCRAGDDIGHQLGDPNEAMVSVALDFLAGRGCTAITAIGTRAAAQRGVLVPASSDSTVRRELPGAYCRGLSRSGTPTPRRRAPARRNRACPAHATRRRQPSAEAGAPRGDGRGEQTALPTSGRAVPSAPRVPPRRPRRASDRTRARALPRADRPSRAGCGSSYPSQ